MSDFTFAVVTEEAARHVPYPYVYALDDGGARELRLSERGYLEELFHPADGGRPYVKSRWEERDGWGSLKGFVARKHVPEGIDILPAPPEEDE